MPRQPARASSGRYVSRLTGGTLAIIMAGGRGERLRDLTAHRCKPATPFGGKFRIIDFVLSNCVNSGIRQISILTQYKAQSLIQHVQHGWSYLRGEFSEFVGVVPATEWNRVTKFAEKPATPDSLPGRPDTILASMGIYVFNTRLLESLLAADAANESSAHDFGRDVLPVAIAGDRQVFAYPFQDVQTRAQSYWRDVGTIDAYYDANLELVHVRPELNIYDQDWPIWTYQVQQPPAKFILDEDGRRGMAVNSMVSGGCIISGAVVRESLLFSDVRVEERTSIHRSVVLPHAEIGRGCAISGAIIDEGCEVPDGTHIGLEREADARRFHVTDKGVVLVTVDMLRSLRNS